MLLTERHIIVPTNPRWKEIDRLSNLSKNFYNRVTDIIVNFRLENKRLPNNSELYWVVKPMEEYRALPTKAAVQLLNHFLGNWYDYLKAVKSYIQNPTKFETPPKPPKNKKEWQRALLVYPLNGISKKKLKKGIIKFSKSDIEVKTKQTNIRHVRIVPKRSHYVIEVVYETQPKLEQVDFNLVSGIDLGVNNLAALTSNKSVFIPILVNGRVLKSINQYFNKMKSQALSKLGKHSNGKKKKWSKRIARLHVKRNNKIEDYLHKASRQIINLLVREGIGTLVIGYNEGWKQGSNMRKANNQNFQSIPFHRFISMLTYKAEMVGIKVIKQEESYTSKCSFLDNEELCHHDEYLGKRSKRGLFISATGIKINADINGSYNIIRKAIPDAFGEGDRGCVVHPAVLKSGFGFHHKPIL